MKINHQLALLTVLALTGCGEGPTGPAGATGATGAAGANGQNGSDGASCSVQAVVASVDAPNGGALLTCGETSTLLLNGAPGPQGEPGLVSPFQLSEVIDPCGDAAGIYDEVILKLANGKLLASFSDKANGQNTRLSELVPGSYITTDGSNCSFQVQSNGIITW